LVKREDIEDYWGYTVKPVDEDFGLLCRSGGFDLTIVTSKHGSQFSEVSGKIVAAWRKSHRILLGFGPPSRGLYEIVQEAGLKLEDIVDFIVNTVPKQGTETVRTEEAVIASLAVLNSQLSSKA
jgi:predicted SPOUT superfamily RNA methylase MTH1